MSANTSWQPDAQIATLQHRAQFIAAIRQFFAERNVMEVETPALCQAGGTDPYSQPFETTFVGPNAATGRTLYLQTSPEFAMKRLLAAGSGPIYQICKAFRNEEAGRMHNPEFTMLEWYRPGFDHHQLMTELDALCQVLLSTDESERLTYQQAFVQHLGINPLDATHQQLAKQADAMGFDTWVYESDRDTLLQLMFSHHVEPNIGQSRPCLVYDFPSSQAALSRISDADPRVCERFELYFKGVELANGFHELSDAEEQRKRFEQDNLARAESGKPVLPVDSYLLDALSSGLPDCAGVAVGLDRMFMLAEGVDEIRSVLSFSIDSV